MDPVTIIALVEACFGLGIKVVELCRTWKGADEEVKERVLTVESVWVRTKHQAELLRGIASVMDDESRRIMGDVLHQLSGYLSRALNTLDSVIQRDSRPHTHLFGFGSRTKRASWLWKKEAIDEIIRNLEAWERRFDPTWFLQLHNPNPLIDSALAKARASETKTTGCVPTVAKNPIAVAAGLREVLAPSPDKTKAVFLPDSPMEWRHIPFSSMKTGRLLRASDTRWYIVDTIEVGAAARVRDVGRDVGVLATKLSRTDPLAFGLLNCKGVMAVPRKPTAPEALPPGQPHHALSLSPPAPDSSIRSPSPGQRDYSHFKLVFRVPDGMDIRQVTSLRQLLLRSDDHLSLSHKVHLARELAKAVNYVHAFAFVHKNIRPESVLCFVGDPHQPDPELLPSRQFEGTTTLFLAGFDAFRAADANTLMAGDVGWERNVYRHPLRQGCDPAERYRMQHDIYSLGVVLLEIGLWESFVEYGNTKTTEEEEEGAGGGGVDGGGPPQPGPGPGWTYAHFQEWLRRRRVGMQRDGGGGSGGGDGGDDFLAAFAFRLKDYLVEQARTRLAPRMGHKYARVVLSCLTCLDDDNEDFGGAEAADASDGAAALCFIESVLKSLEDISV